MYQYRRDHQRRQCGAHWPVPLNCWIAENVWIELNLKMAWILWIGLVYMNQCKVLDRSGVRKFWNGIRKDGYMRIFRARPIDPSSNSPTLIEPLKRLKVKSRPALAPIQVNSNHSKLNRINGSVENNFQADSRDFLGSATIATRRGLTWRN